MDFSASDFVSVNEIISDVTAAVNDRDFSSISKGYYTSMVQFALQELAYDTLFDVKHESIPIPRTGNLIIDMPKGSFNIRNMWLYSGDNCNIDTAQKVWWKKNMYNTGGASISNNTGRGGDPFTNRVSIPGNLYFGNVQKGMIMLSDSCRAFENILIEYNGVGCDIGETPTVPMHLRMAVNLFVRMEALTVLKGMSIGTGAFSHYHIMYNDAEKQLYGRRGTEDSVWSEAISRVSSLSKHKRNDLKEYFTRINS